MLYKTRCFKALVTMLGKAHCTLKKKEEDKRKGNQNEAKTQNQNNNKTPWIL